MIRSVIFVSYPSILPKVTMYPAYLKPWNEKINSSQLPSLKSLSTKILPLASTKPSLFITSIWTFVSCILTTIQGFIQVPPKPPKTETQVVYPVPLSGLDYLAILVTQAATDFQGTPVDPPSDISKQHIQYLPICCLYYSKAFPLTFGKFCHRIADCVEESDTKSS